MSLYIGRGDTQLTESETYFAPEIVNKQYFAGANNNRAEEEEKEEETEGKNELDFPVPQIWVEIKFYYQLWTSFFLSVKWLLLHKVVERIRCANMCKTPDP